MNKYEQVKRDLRATKIKRELYRIYGLAMLLLPIVLWILLLTSKGFEWTNGKIVMMLCASYGGGFTAWYIFSEPFKDLDDQVISLEIQCETLAEEQFSIIQSQMKLPNN